MPTRIDLDNEQFRFSCGVDQVTSSFFQIWLQPHDDQDQPLVAADNQGVRVAIDEDTGATVELSPKLYRMVEQLKGRFRHSRATGNRYPNLAPTDIFPFAEYCGFTDATIKQRIYEALD